MVLRLVSLIAAVAAALAPVHPARAQAAPSAQVGLVSQPVWHDEEARLGLRVRVTNTGTEPLQGFRIQVAAYGRALSRSDLHESFDGVVGIADTIPTEYPDEVVAPGTSTSVLIDDRITDLSLVQSGVNGVYPLTISLFDATGFTLLDEFTTELVYYPHRPQTPVGLVTVVPINDIPARGPDGVFRAALDGTHRLEAAVEPGGWLAGLVEALDKRAGTGVRLGLAPKPRILEELDDMADGYRLEDPDGTTSELGPNSQPARNATTVLENLRELARRPNVQVIQVPYSFVDLPSLGQSLPERLSVDQLLAQRSEGARVTDEVLGSVPDRSWLFVPAGRLDLATMETLQQAGVEHTILSTDSLEQSVEEEVSGCPSDSPTFTCLIRVPTSVGETLAYRSDDGLQDRLAAIGRSPGKRLEYQRLFAELAMIREELPARAGRTVQMTIPSLHHPMPRFSNLLMRGLERAPWLETMSPGAGLFQTAETVERNIVEDASRLHNRPPEGYFAAVADATEIVDHFREIRPPDGKVQRLRRNILVAESRTWWMSPELTLLGESYARDAASEARRDLDRIGIGGQDRVTLTSRRGTLQMSVFNETGYPVTLAIHLSATKLDFQSSTIEQTFEPGTTPLTVEVTAESSGIVPVEVTLATPGGFEIQGNTSISVRSTQFNEIAVAVTLGALGFLVIFYVYRGIHRRRTKDDQEAAEAASS